MASELVQPTHAQALKPDKARADVHLYIPYGSNIIQRFPVILHPGCLEFTVI